MRNTTRMATLAMLMTLPMVAMAAPASGRYASASGKDKTMEMPDGTTVVTSRYSQITFADDQAHLLDNQAEECVGRFHMAADGKTLSGSGTCTSVDAQGDTMSFWWRVDKIGTSDCADLCGSWGYYAGTGKYKGIQGTGTWERTTVFPNGSSTGTWQGDATLK